MGHRRRCDQDRITAKAGRSERVGAVPDRTRPGKAEWVVVSRWPLFVLAVFCTSCGLAASSSGVDVVGSASSPEVANRGAPTATFEVIAPLDVIGAVPPPNDDDEMIVEPVVDRPTSVAVVGDSLTVSAADEIELALDAIGLDVIAFDALESRRIARGGSGLPPGTSAVEQILDAAILAEEPELWVIALGTNDVASVGSLDEFRPEMRELLDLIPSDVPVIWVDLWIGARTDSIRQANRMIRAELRQWAGGSAVVDWFAHGDDDGVITGDGVHLTDEGQQLFASSIADTVDEMFAP